MKHSIASLLFILIWCGTAICQDFLEINTSNHCIYTGSNLPEELYSFEISDSIEQLKNEILEKTGYAQNFDFVCSNVPSVVAVVSKSKRFVLYSRKFFSNQPDRSVRLAMLAHEIGHHVNEHKLIDGHPTEAEEMEADAFMGYALFLTRVPEEIAEVIAAMLPLASGMDSIDRQIDIMHGYKKATASLYNAGHVGWDENDINQVYHNFPKFLLPAPKASAEANLDNNFKACKTLYDVDQKLRTALTATGYNTRRYLCVPDGFVLVTQMEQFNRNGTVKSDNYRWSNKVVRCEDFSTMCYLNALFTSDPGYFRIFVFIVTPHSLTNSARPVSQKDAGNWLDEGANKLPPALSKLPFDANTNVTCLIYEFKVREGNRQPVMSTPSELDGLEHLRKSKIISFL